MIRILSSSVRTVKFNTCTMMSFTNNCIVQAIRTNCTLYLNSRLIYPVSSVRTSQCVHGSSSANMCCNYYRAVQNKCIHTVSMNLLSVEPVHLISQRYIRYKAEFRSQHQDHSQVDKSVSKSTVDSPKVDSKDDPNKITGIEVASNETSDKPSLYQRFKQTYKQHGKIFIAVHLITSAAWFSSFYLAVKSGVDIVPYLEKWNFSEKVISPFRSDGKLGALAITLLMYKLAAPARYAVTLGGTNLVIKYLRKEGKMKEIPQEDRLRSLYQEGKENLKSKSRVRIKKLRRKAKLGKGSKHDSS